MIALNRFIQIMLMGLLAVFGQCAGADAPAGKISVKAGDFSTILAAKSKELTVWQYSVNPDIYIFDFPNLTQQGMTFNRITQLSEQFTEPYKRVLNNKEIDEYLVSIRRTRANMAFGHDVLVSNLVLFLNLAENDKVELNPEEKVLRDFAMSQGLIKVWRKFYQSVQPNVVILSIPQTQEKRANEPSVSELARRTVFMHEISHGEFFTNSYYSKYCAHFWYDVLSEAQRNTFKIFLSKYNYSLSAEELLINETQAYLLFTPDTSSFSAEKLGITDEELEGMRKDFRKGMPATGLPVN